MRKFLLLAFSLLLFTVSYCQDSCGIRVSLLTCSPGEELYSTFGHTAVRIVDEAAGTDLVYNYGTFEFDDDFYINFIRGKLLYYLSVQEFSDFMYQYEYENRSVVEQMINMNCREKQELVTALNENAKESNRYYRYDFLFDNCTTRAGDMIEKNSAVPVVHKNILPAKIPTFRNLLHDYLDKGGQHWSKLGIDILLGAKLDRKVSNQEARFLPDYLMKGFDSTVKDHEPLVVTKAIILRQAKIHDGLKIFTPFAVFLSLMIVVFLLTFLKKRWAIVSLRVFDQLFFALLGLTGILLLFMWFGTDHVVCRNNYNLLWALPSHFLIAFFLRSKKPWLKRYFQATTLLSNILLVTFFFIPQQINISVIPLLVIIITRSWRIIKSIPDATTNRLS